MPQADRPSPAPKNPDASPGRHLARMGTGRCRPDRSPSVTRPPCPTRARTAAGPLIETGTAEQFQTEIPRTPLIRQFTVHLGGTVPTAGVGPQGGTRSRHPTRWEGGGQSDHPRRPGRGGPGCTLRTGCPTAKWRPCLGPRSGSPFRRGACAQINGRSGTRLEPEYQRILVSIRTSKHLSADETGWRVGGHNAWLHVWVGDEATGYAIDSGQRKRRRPGASDRGGLVGSARARRVRHHHDRFGHAVHQSCLAHVLRRARGTARGRHAWGGAVPASVDRVVHRGDPPAQPVGRPSGTGPGAGTSSARGSTTGCWLWCGPDAWCRHMRRWRSTCTNTWSSGFRSCSIPKSSRPTGRPSRRSARRWSIARCGAGTGPEPVRTPKGSSCPCSRHVAGTLRSGARLPQPHAPGVRGNRVLPRPMLT